MGSEEEFNRLLIRAMLSGGALFLLAGGALLIFMRGLGKEDRNEKDGKSGHAGRAAALVGILMVIALYFMWLAFG